jgi:cytochrome c oxidase subunit IV
MIQDHEIRRHANGAIDLDFYRTEAIALRQQAMRDAFKLKATFAFALLTISMIVGATIVASVPVHWIWRNHA